MPFPTTYNWVQHAFMHGVCQRCALQVTHEVTGEFWSVEGAILREEPTGTNWTVCTAP